MHLCTALQLEFLTSISNGNKQQAEVTCPEQKDLLPENGEISQKGINLEKSSRSTKSSNLILPHNSFITLFNKKIIVIKSIVFLQKEYKVCNFFSFINDVDSTNIASKNKANKLSKII